MKRRRDVRYGRNPPPPYHMRFGRKVMDPATGLPTYEDKLVPDEWGTLCDPELGGYDTREVGGPEPLPPPNPFSRR